MRLAAGWASAILIASCAGQTAPAAPAVSGQPDSDSASLNSLHARRVALREALVWVRSGPYRLELRDVAAQNLKMTIDGPQSPGQSDVDLLVPDDHGRGAALAKAGFKAPDARHSGYWWDDLGVGDSATDDDDDGPTTTQTPADPSKDPAIAIVESVYLTVWQRPLGYRLAISKSTPVT